MLKKIKRKFIIINMACVSVIILLVYIAICYMSYRTEKAAISGSLTAICDEIIREEEQLTGDDSPHRGDAEILNFETFTAVISEDGNIERYYIGIEANEGSEALSAACADALANEKSDGILWNHTLFFVRRTSGTYVYITFTSVDNLTNRIQTISYVSGSVLIACLALFFILSYVLADYAIGPAERTWEAQKQFIQDASHDLKTPLTVILANTEIIKSHKSDSVESVNKWLCSTKEEAERMKRLVDSMLEQTGSESLRENVTLTDCDISELTESTVLQMEPIAFEKNIIIDSRIERGIAVKCHPDSFTRLVHILIDNGIKYASENTALSVTLTRERREARLSVINRGSYIKEEDLPHIFERFYRGDKARTEGGFGLGLSIAKNLCESMSGQIRAESVEDSYTKFTVSFPVADRILNKLLTDIKPSGRQ